jgi:hypothetical protein
MGLLPKIATRPRQEDERCDLGFFDGVENGVLKALVDRYESSLQLSNPLRLLARFLKLLRAP